MDWPTARNIIAELSKLWAHSFAATPRELLDVEQLFFLGCCVQTGFGLN